MRAQVPNGQVHINPRIVGCPFHGIHQVLDAFHVTVPRRVQFGHVLADAAPQDIEAIAGTGLAEPVPQTLGAVGHLQQGCMTFGTGGTLFIDNQRVRGVQDLHANAEGLQQKSGSLQALGERLDHLAGNVPEWDNDVHVVLQTLFVLGSEVSCRCVSLLVVGQREQVGEEAVDGVFDVLSRFHRLLIGRVDYYVVSNVLVETFDWCF